MPHLRLQVPEEWLREEFKRSTGFDANKLLDHLVQVVANLRMENPATPGFSVPMINLSNLKHAIEPLHYAHVAGDASKRFLHVTLSAGNDTPGRTAAVRLHAAQTLGEEADKFVGALPGLASLTVHVQDIDRDRGYSTTAERRKEAGAGAISHSQIWPRVIRELVRNMGIAHVFGRILDKDGSPSNVLWVREGRMRFCFARWVVLPLAGGLVFAQTQVDLKLQSKNVDFSGAAMVKPVPVGTTLPTLCSPGSMFFKSNAVPGANLYACVATNTWVVESGSGGGGVNDDLRADSISALFTLSEGKLNFIVNGLPVTFSFGPTTITSTAGSDTGTFFIYGDYNSGAPVIRCGYGAGINIGNYSISSGFSGSTCVGAPGFPAETIPLATVDISVGIFQPPFDQRAFYSRDTILAGMGLIKTGNVLSVDASVFPSFTGMTAIRESHSFIDGGYTQGLQSWAFSAACTNPGIIAGSSISIYQGVSFGSPDSASTCFEYRSQGGSTTAMAHADVFSGSSPQALDSRNVYKRVDANGNHYIGMSGSTANVNNFIGCWYDASANLWKSLIRSGGTTLDSDSTGVAGSTNAVVASFGNNKGTANSITCSINGASATSAGTIPSTTWIRVLGTLATGTPDAVFEVYESRFEVDGINRSAN